MTENKGKQNPKGRKCRILRRKKLYKWQKKYYYEYNKIDFIQMN